MADILSTTEARDIQGSYLWMLHLSAFLDKVAPSATRITNLCSVMKYLESGIALTTSDYIPCRKVA
jgi:hypothetical protein